jgi:hypothetical protein
VTIKPNWSFSCYSLESGTVSDGGRFGLTGTVTFLTSVRVGVRSGAGEANFVITHLSTVWGPTS